MLRSNGYRKTAQNRLEQQFADKPAIFFAFVPIFQDQHGDKYF